MNVKPTIAIQSLKNVSKFEELKPHLSAFALNEVAEQILHSIDCLRS